jgi:isoquinoline 1-oxidoreductase alpha subunit
MQLIVNGTTQEVAGDPSRALLFVLRDELSLTGTKPACGEAVCGACTVLVDGEPIRSCVTPLGEVVGRSVTTIEGLAQAGTLSPVQRALLAERAFQCGYCTPGVALAITALVRQANPGTSDRDLVEDNICRCGAYPRLRRAIERVRSSSVGEIGGDDIAARVEEPATEPGRVPWDRQEPADRDYFQVLGDGLVIVVPPPEEGSSWVEAWTTSGGVWLHVGSDGRTTAFTGKVEMGQNNRSALASIVANGIAVHPEAARIVMADTDFSPV